MQQCNHGESSNNAGHDQDTLQNTNVNCNINVQNQRPKGTGRKKIEILQKIENKLSRKVAFTKRRKGLFKKAVEICNICPNAQIAIIVFSAKGRLFSCGTPSVDDVVNRFLSEKENGSGGVPAMDAKEEEEEEEEEDEPIIGDYGEFWFDVSIENLDGGKLEDFVANLEGLVINLCMRHEELVMRRTCEIDFLANFGA